MTADAYFKKTLAFKYGGEVLRLRVSQDLFSSFDVDTGSQRLLRSLAGADVAASARILDLGCGYGPLGLALKKIAPGRTVYLVDRDALAVEYARQNAVLNGLEGVEAYGSLGYDDVSTVGLDLILCNIPAKAGEPVISSLLRDAVHFLRPGGLVAVVVVTQLEPAVAGALQDDEVQVQLRKAWPGHTVFHYRFVHGPSEAFRPALERGVYDRQEMAVSFRGLTFSVHAAYGLPQHDTLSRETERLIEGLIELQGTAPRRAVVLNPGQGHVPVALWRLLRPAQVALVDRDLLSLRYARKNLLLNGCPEGQVVLRHQVGLHGPAVEQADLLAGVLREEEGREAIAALIEQAAQQMSPAGVVVLAGSSTAVTRVVEQVRSGRHFTIQKRERSKGRSLLALRRR